MSAVEWEVSAVEEERDQVLRWRIQELSAVGYRLDQALAVASVSEIDLHLASDLVRHGCPPETALKILL